MNKGLKSSLRTFVCIVTAVMTVGGFIFESRAQAQALDNSKADTENHSKSIFLPESLSPVNSIYVRSQKLVANDAAAIDQFGRSVSVSGNTAIVGADRDDIGTNTDQGSAYIYVRNGGTWDFQQKLTASDGAAGDYFGFSVDIDGDTVVIGAFGDDINSLQDRGSAYVFTRSGTTWTQQAKLINPDDYMGDTYGGELFGYSVAIDGNRIIVGAPDDHTLNDNLSVRRGSASVFERSGSVWFLLTKILGSEYPTGGGSARFGQSVGISGTTVITGAPAYPPSGRGAALIYTPGFPNWILQKQLDGVIASNGFGHTVAIDGDTAVVGARTLVGKAYVSEFQAGVWTNPIELTSGGSGQTFNGAFGDSVSIDGDMLVVGSPGSGGRGNAYVFRRINNIWTYKAQLFQKDVPVGTGDCFGGSFGVDGNRIIGGAVCNSVGGQQTGAASIFLNVSPRPFDFNGGGVSDVSVFRPSTSDWFSADPVTGGYLEIHYGTSGDEIAPADFDGDGKTDIAVFRPSEGVWYILNSSTSQTSFVSWGLSGDVPMPNDFDGDGKADVALFRPSNSTWYWINSSNQQTSSIQFGQSGDAPLMADFDGDARGELALFRPASGTFTWFNLATSQTSSQAFGLSTDIPTPGDFDGDSKTDIAIFRPSVAEWYRINSSNGQLVTFAFGAPGDVPTVADFDGDGETDAAVFRLSTRVWYISNSSFYDSYSLGPQFTITSFGLSGDVAVPATYLP